MRTTRRSRLTAAAVLLIASAALVAQSAPAQATLPPMTTATKAVTRTPAGFPAVVGIHVGAHPTYDRIVININGNAPGYRVGYVAHVYRDPSGLPVTLSGAADLQVTLKPAFAHNISTGRSCLLTPSRMLFSYSAVREYRVVGDFEGVVSIGVGARRLAPFRVFTLSSPTRIVIDIAH
jgi:hypothetical protein